MDEPELHNSLVALHSASFAWAVSCCHDRELAEEVLQSVYVKLLDAHSPYKEGSSFRTWLFAVIRNAARDHQRKRWWSRVLRLELDALAELVDSASTDHSTDDQEDELAIVRAALGKLPDRQRQVAHLVFYEDLTIEEAAKVMGVTLGAARQHYARAKKSLRNSLKPLQN
jgi:RNA polymerase sigma-70 factor, ECF subfamily